MSFPISDFKEGHFVDNGSKVNQRKHIKIEYSIEHTDTIDTKTEQINKESDTGVKSKEMKRGLIVEEEIDCKKSKWEPLNWPVVLNNIREMRKGVRAPVDDMGCDHCQDEDAPPEVQRYHTLIAAILSSRTKDEVTQAAMQRLRAHGLTIDNMLNTDHDTLGKLIQPVESWKNKVRFIKMTSKTLKLRHGGDVPNTLKVLRKLPGVGPLKRAELFVELGLGAATDIGEDTHVHYIANRLGWVRGAETPEETKKELEDWLPQDLWNQVNHLLVGFGQTICRPVLPKCASCLNKDLCPFANQVFKKSTE